MCARVHARYAKHHEIESKREYLTEQQRQLQQEQSSRPHTSGHSQALMEKLKRRRFQQVRERESVRVRLDGEGKGN
jgi:hypothetical protein